VLTFLSVAWPTLASLQDTFTVTTEDFSVTFEQQTYVFVEPFFRELSIWGTVTNLGGEDDTVLFTFMKDDGSESPAGFVFLESGQSTSYEFGHITREMKDQNNKGTVRIKMASAQHPRSQTEAAITVLFPPDELSQALSSTITIRAYDASTRQPIVDSFIFYYLSPASRTERVRPMGSGRYQASVPDSDAVLAVANENGLAWDGYTVEVQTPGYRAEVLSQLNPKKDSPVAVDVFLEPLVEVADFQSAWLNTLAYPGVWRVRTSTDGGYVAVALGKHPDAWDPKSSVPTHAYLFRSNGERVWQYPLEDAVWGMDISPDGSLVAVGTLSGSLHVVTRDGKTAWTKQVSRPSNLRELRFSHTGAYLAGETSLRAIEVYDANTGEVVYTYDPGVEVFWRGVTFSEDDRYAAFAGDGSLILVDLNARKPLWRGYVSGVPYDVRIPSDLSSVVVADKGDALWSYGFDGTLRWVRRDLTVLTDMDMSADGSRVVTLSHDGTVRQYDEEGNLLWRRAVGFGGHNGLDMTADGRFIAVGSGGKDFPYSVFLLDGDGNMLWTHSEPGPVPDPYHPYMMSAMSVTIADDASAIVAGYGTGNPGVQWFTGVLSEVRNMPEGEGTLSEVADGSAEDAETVVAVFFAVGLLVVVVLAIILKNRKRHRV
jgi:outer membrane protein assembly factor BamB